MFCGSCMHDNTLVSALVAQGHDALLIPTYTPIRTDEPDVSQQRIFFGGINVFLQQKLSLFRHTPWFFDRLLDARRLLNWASRFAVKTQAEVLGDLTLSMLKGEHGYQKKEIAKLVHWLATHHQPQILVLTNALLSGMIHDLKQRIQVPVLCTLQGDDVFLEALPEKWRQPVLQLVREHCRQIDGFIATSNYYADFMTDYFQVPRERIHVVYPGLNLAGHGGSGKEPTKLLTVGYFARICPEKGLHLLADAFRLLKKSPALPSLQLRISGWLGENNRSYWNEIERGLIGAGLAGHFERVESPDHDSKVRFLQGLDVLCVPTTYREPKGLYVLEAWANGVPVVQPRHGSFPELIEATGGGLLVPPNSPEELAAGLRQLLETPDLRREMGQKGKKAVQERFHAERMAQETTAVFQYYVA